MTPEDLPTLEAAVAALERNAPLVAERILHAFLETRPDDVEALNLLAVVQDWLKKVPECIATLERLRELAPKRIDPARYRLLAKLHVFTGDRKKARTTATQAVAIHPGSHELQIMRAGLADTLEDTCAELEEALKKAAGNPTAEAEILDVVTTSRARLARERKGLPSDAVSWHDTATWHDPEGLARFRDVLDAQNKVKSRADLVLGAACVAICDGDWDRADALFDLVRARTGKTLADYAGFGAKFHAQLGAFDYETIARALPPVNHILSPAPQSGETLLFASDPGYFRNFTLPFLSAVEQMELPLDVQVHIMGGDLAAWCGMAAGLDTFKHVRVALSAEDPGRFTADTASIALYCHAIRFVRLYQEAARNQRRMWVFDVDVFIQHDPRPLFARLKDCDVALRTNPCLLTPPAKVAGNLVGIAPTPRGLEFARRVAAYIMYWKERGTWAWGIDQVALFSVLGHMNRTGQAPLTYYQGAADAANGEDGDPTFYFPTGIKKYFAAKSAT